MDGLDEYITAFDDREPIEDKFSIEGFEYLGTFHNYEKAMEYLMTTELSEEEFKEDYIYKIRECE